MEEKKVQPKKLTLSNTKQEMLEAYHTVLKQLEAQKEVELKPEKKLEEKKAKEVVQVADSLSSEGIARETSNLKIETGKMLAQISDRMEEEINRYKAIQNAVALKEKELQELYEIEKSAMTLAALIESQNQKRQAFESEMAAKKEALNQEIETLVPNGKKKKRITKPRSKNGIWLKRRGATGRKKSTTMPLRENRSWPRTNLRMKRQSWRKRSRSKKEQMESELKIREKVIAEQEAELNELRKKVSAFPKEMEAAVNKAVKETTERINLEAKNREEFQKREFAGEKNVLTTRIESLEKTVKEQSERIVKLNQQLEKAYQQVQDIAVKTIEGSSNIKSFANLQQLDQ